MTPTFLLIEDLAATIAPPPDGILSRTLFRDEHSKVVAFGFSAGQELSEHTAARPAIMHFLSGEASVTLGDDTVAVRAGSWIHMPAQLRHAIRAKTPVVMLLTLLS